MKGARAVQSPLRAGVLLSPVGPEVKGYSIGRACCLSSPARGMCRNLGVG
jgi:hypothetical protein